MKTSEEHWWNDTGPSHCTTDRQSFIHSFSQLIIQLVSSGVETSWRSRPKFSPVLNTAICQSSGALSKECAGLPVAVGHRLCRLRVFTYTHNVKYRNF